MLKGLFLTLPSISINNTLTPVINTLAADHYRIKYYDTARPAGVFAFATCLYPPYEGGYNSNCLDTDLSFYRFAETMIDTATGLMDFLVKEVEREKPDFILHPHLSVWAKLLAARYQLPAIALSSTFFMDRRIMQPWFRKLFPSGDTRLAAVGSALSYYKKARVLYKKLGLQQEPDIWDTYLNKEALNIAFILKALQPDAGLPGHQYKYAGFSMAITPPCKKQPLVYISLGTMLNNDTGFYRLCIEALQQTHSPAIIAVGNKVGMEALGPVPGHISIVRYANQPEILARAALFITSGGMASIQEAIYTRTPVIVIPQTTEQHITAERVGELGIGIQLPKKTLTTVMLTRAIVETMANEAAYAWHIQQLLLTVPCLSAAQTAAGYIEHYLQGAVLNH